MFKIEEIYTPDSTPLTSLDVLDIRDLPYALKRLTELGYDLHKSLEVLQEAVDEQRKQDILKAAINALAEKKS